VRKSRITKVSGYNRLANAGAAMAQWKRVGGSFAAVLKGTEAIVFCGGMDERTWHVRGRVLEGMEWIGVELDRSVNRSGSQTHQGDASPYVPCVSGRDAVTGRGD
jgi:acetate kinase